MPNKDMLYVADLHRGELATMGTSSAAWQTHIYWQES